MSQSAPRHEMTRKRVVYEFPDMDAVSIERDVTYRATDAEALTMDLYYPPQARRHDRIPAVVVVAGYPDAGFEAFVGCKFKEMGSCVSWGQLIAASGLVAITYTNREPAADLSALLRHVRQHAAALGINENSIGLWASSGNVPLALSVLMQEASADLKCAVLCYAYTLDADGSAGVAEASRRFGFVNPCAGKSVHDLPREVPLFIARAGHDEMPGLNDTLDRFLVNALASNLPVTFVNHPTAPHAFDLNDDSDISRKIVRQILAFMRFHLLP